MKKFIEFEIHDYMDMYPRKDFIAMEESEIYNFVNHMNKMYSGGTTRFVHVLTKEEAIQHVLNEIKDVVKRPTVTHKDGSLDSIDVEFIKNLITQLENCYN